MLTSAAADTGRDFSRLPSKSYVCPCRLLAERVLRPLQPGAVVFGGDLVDAKTLLMQGLQYEDEWQASHVHQHAAAHTVHHEGQQHTAARTIQSQGAGGPAGCVAVKPAELYAAHASWATLWQDVHCKVVALELGNHRGGCLVTTPSRPVQLPDMPFTHSNRQGCHPHILLVDFCSCQGCGAHAHGCAAGAALSLVPSEVLH